MKSLIGEHKSNVHEIELKFIMNDFNWDWFFLRKFKFTKLFNSFYLSSPVLLFTKKYFYVSNDYYFYVE